MSRQFWKTLLVSQSWFSKRANHCGRCSFKILDLCCYGWFWLELLPLNLHLLFI